MKAENAINYRATFILNTRGYEEPVETIVEKLKGDIAAIGGEVKQAQSLGRKEFTRVVEKSHPGDTYVQIEFTGPKNSVTILQEKLRLESLVKRVLVQKLN